MTVKKLDLRIQIGDFLNLILNWVRYSCSQVQLHLFDKECRVGGRIRFNLGRNVLTEVEMSIWQLINVPKNK